ncbi:hypothetical protein SHIRM173S_03232 [Streptomyces hirsutus]
MPGSLRDATKSAKAAAQRSREALGRLQAGAQRLAADVGSIAAMVTFAKRVAHLANVSGVVDPDGKRVVHSVTGEPFSASSNDLVHQFDYKGDPDDVVVDLSGTARRSKRVTHRHGANVA